MTETGEISPLKGATPKRRQGADERLANTGWLVRLLRRPESGVACGLIATVVIFACVR